MLRVSNSLVRLKVGPWGKEWVEEEGLGCDLSSCFYNTWPVDIETFFSRQVSWRGVLALQLTSTGVTCRERLSISLTIFDYNLSVLPIITYICITTRRQPGMQKNKDSERKKSRLRKERSPQPKSSIFQSFKGYLYPSPYPAPTFPMNSSPSACPSTTTALPPASPPTEYPSPPSTTASSTTSPSSGSPTGRTAR